MRSILLSVLFLFLLNITAKAQTYKVGDAVNIDWKGKQYPGKIIEVKSGSYLVSYDGYGADWNETVKPERLQPYATNTLSLSTIVSPTPTDEVSYKGVETIWDIEVSKDDKLIVCANSYGSLLILSAVDLSFVKDIKIGSSPVMSVSISSDGLYIAAGCADGKIYVYTQKRGTDWEQYAIIDGYKSISKLRFSPVKNDLYIAGAPKADYTKTIIDVWNTETKSVKQTLLKSTVGDHVISGISFTKDGSKVAFAISNNKAGIEVYGTATGKLAYKISTTFDVVACSFSADGSVIAGGGTDKAVSVWNTTTKAKLWTTSWNKGSTDYLYSLAIAPDGKTIAACGMGTGNRVKIYDITTGKIKAEMGKTNPGGNAVTYSADSKSVFVALTTYGDIAKVAIVYKSSVPE